MPRLIQVGSVDQTVDVFIQDSSSTVGAGLSGLVFNTSGLKCYFRKGATGSATQLTLATQTVGGAHSDGGFVEIDATNMKGQYRLDLSDTIVAASGPVYIYLYGATNMAPVVRELQIVGFDPAALTWLTPTVVGRTLDVSAGGEAGIDWANIGSPTTAQNLSGTNIDVDQVVASVSGAVGSVTGAVGSVAAGGITASSIAADAIGASELATDAVTEIANAVADTVWDEARADHTTAGTFGQGAASVQGNVTGSVGSVATGGIAAASFAAGAIDSAAIAADAIGASEIAADAIGSSELAATAATEIADAVKGRQLTESYAADTVAPTVEQALMSLHQNLQEFAISGTTLTVKKLDKATTAQTYTLDSATDPTSRTRAT